MNYYQVLFLNPINGNRIILEGVQAEIEVINDFTDISKLNSPYHFRKKKSLSTYLDIILEMATPTKKQLEQLKEQILNQDMLLWFKDTHPNLIKGRIGAMTTDPQKITIAFKGNTIDKTYLDYVTEVSTGLKAEQHVLTLPEDPIDDSIIESKETRKPLKPPPSPQPKKRKDSNGKVVLKRKLTFK